MSEFCIVVPIERTLNPPLLLRVARCATLSSPLAIAHLTRRSPPLSIQSYYNTLDLFITAFCCLTLLVLFSSGCSAKGEEVFDIVLLVARNLFQFGRLALVMRKSGKNVFTRPAPIDLSAAREYSYSLDLDLDDEEGELAERRALGGDVEAQRGSKGRGGRGEERPFTLDDGSDED